MPSLKPFRIAATYAVVSALWILFSDRAAGLLFSSTPDVLVWVSMAKGWFYVSVVACLLWFTLVRFERQSMFQSAQLQNSEERYRRIVETANEGICILDASFAITYVNRVFSQMLGYEEQELLGRPLSGLFAPEELPDHLQREKERRAGHPGRYERRFQRKDGRKLTTIISAMPIMTAPDTFEGSVAMITDITEGKQAERALRESEARYRSVIENISDVYYRTDARGNMIMVSPSCAKLLGYDSVNDILGYPNTQFWQHPELRSEFLERIKSEGEVRDYEVVLLRRDGSPLTVSTSSKFYHDADGAVAGVEGIFRDITERKRAEEALRDNEERLRVIFETSPSAILLVDAAGSVVMANKRALELFGYPQDVLLGMPYLHLVTPEQRELSRNTMLQVMSGEIDHVVSLERNYLRADGATFWGQLAGRSLEGPGGEFRGLVGIITDITERKQAEEKLEAAYVLIDSILDSIPTAIISMDEQGFITHFNRSAQTLSESPFLHALGKPLHEIIPQLPFSAEELEAARLEHRTIRAIRTPMSSGSTIRLMDILVFPLDVSGQVRMAVTLEDVTERVRVEEVMVQTEKMMSVGGLAAGMAHEINNPLGGILQSVQIIKRRLSPDIPRNDEAAGELGLKLADVLRYLESREIPTFVDAIQDSGVRAAHIVSNMLEFSRFSESKRTPANLAGVLDKAVELASNDYDLKKRFDFRRVKIVREYDQNLPEVRCSRTELEQVIFNLVKNAAQAMAGVGATGSDEAAPDAPHITLRLTREGDFARIEVEDNGPGMSEEVRRRVFEPFYTTKPPGDGTGLGLSVSYFIITSNHKGTIEVESHPGRGTKFIIRLPLEDTSGESGSQSLPA
ncbi:MAG: PAS/PAC sensor signal transduction histidine [Desulfovibrionaceae bacterium]|nr:MAG: PAS/PAC sensor signal transduction histidine [Desulfovibrionaceae bacterium]